MSSCVWPTTIWSWATLANARVVVKWQQKRPRMELRYSCRAVSTMMMVRCFAGQWVYFVTLGDHQYLKKYLKTMADRHHDNPWGYCLSKVEGEKAMAGYSVGPVRKPG